MPITELMMRLVEQEEMLRLQRFAKARLAYDGQLLDPLLPTKGDPKGRDNVKLNFSRLVVDIGVDFLFGVGLDFGKEQEEDATDEDTDVKPKTAPEDQWLEDAWGYNSKQLLLTDAGINGGICGHSFIRMAKPTDQTKGFPRLIVIDPATVTPFHELDDYDDIFAWKIQWNTVDARKGKPAVRRQMITRNDQRTAWEIVDEVAVGMSITGERNRWWTFSQIASKWERIGSEVWPYSWSPVFHCKNLPAPNCFWGTSDLEPDIVDTNDSVNFVLSNMKRIIRNHAHPQPVGHGFNATQVTFGDGGIIGIPTKDGKLEYLEMKGDLSSSLELYARLKEAYHEMSRVPEIATGKVDGIGALSGVALKLLYGPFAAKTRTKQNLYGHMLSQINARMLELAGKGEDTVIENRFGNIIPIDDKESAETATIEEQLGVSRDTLLEKLGYDPFTERKKKEKEQAAQDARDAQKMQTEANIGDQLLNQFDRGRGRGS